MKKYMKKISRAMLLAILLSVALAPSLPASAATFAGGSGTSEDPYLISTAAQMNAVRNDLDAHYKLVNDIDLSSYTNWNPIDNFTGSFDGGGCTVSGLRIYDTWGGEKIGNTTYTYEEYALFGKVEGNISNVNLENVNIQVYVKRTITSSVSVDVAAVAGSVNGSVTNCTASGTIKVYDEKDLARATAAGIVAVQYGGSVTNCHSSVEVTATLTLKEGAASAAGIVGSFNGTEIKDCVNTGDVLVTCYDSPEAGGIAGGSGYNAGNIMNCYNMGRISVDRNYSGSGYAYAAGIVPFCSYKDEIRNCGNYGTIYAIGGTTGSCAGGLAGSYQGTIKNSFNSGSVTASAYGGYNEAGGIAATSATVDSCFNSGSIVASGTNASSLKAGGIVGSAYNPISNVYNAGDVMTGSGPATTIAGGIAATASDSISHAYEVGGVGVGTGGTCGSIAGRIYQNSSSSTSVTDCYYLNTSTTAVGQNSDGCSVSATAGSSTTLKTQSTFKQFDFTNVWVMGTGDYRYPQLRTTRSALEVKEDFCTVVGHALNEHAAKAATCEAIGWNAYETCFLCGHTTYAELPALGHDYSVYTVITEPTCTTVGAGAMCCKNCGGYESTTEIAALGHDYSKVTVKKEATCTEPGYEEISCKNCGMHEFVDKILVDKEAYPYPESDHPYGTNINKTYEFSYPKANNLYLLFSQDTKVENRYDKIYIKDFVTNTETMYTGTALAGKEIKVSGGAVQIRITSDGSVVENGFSLDAIYADVAADSVKQTIPALGHDWGEGIVNTQPSCIKDGNTHYDCSRCDETKDETIVAKGHEWNTEPTVDIEATCIRDGEQSIYCSVCKTKDAESTEILPALGHDWGTGTVNKQPSCTEDGNTHYDCSRCQEVKDEPIAAPGHEWSDEPVVHQQPSCTATGYQSIVCTVCKTNDLDRSEILPALGHDWGTGTVNKQPSCTEDGNTHYDCSRCDETKDEPIGKTGHTWNTEYTIDTPAGCATLGTKSIRCSVCNEQDKDSIVQIEILGHNWSDGVVTKPVSCTEDGNTHYECDRCKEAKDVPIKAAGHQWNKVVTIDKPATCEEDGSQSIRCSICEEQKADTIATIPSTGHDWGEGTVDNPASCTEDGNIHYDCSRCDETKDEPIPAAGHQWNKEVTIDKPATCEEDGSQSIRCSVCEEQKADTIVTIPSTGHDWSEWAVSKAPTYLLDGEEAQTCGNCGNKNTRSLAKLGNPFTDVPETQYYYTPVLWAVENGITAGLTQTTFGPNNPCTRGQIVTFLWRSMGSPEPKTIYSPFVDVASDQYYYKAVLWAVENGITAGTSTSTFSPNAVCTRGQIVSFLHRTMGSPEPTSANNPFTDVPETQYYYKAVLWAVENGVTSGLTQTTFGPSSPCTRGQVVSFLHRTLGK